MVGQGNPGSMESIVGHRYLRAGVLGLLLATTAATAAGLPPISAPPTGEKRPGKFVWADLVTPDVVGAQRFYGGLFGWSFAGLGSGSRTYTLAYVAGYPVAGMVQRAPDPEQARQSRWVAFMSVPDVAATVRRVTEQGGTTLIPARRVEGRGDMAILADPDGAPFGVIRSSSGDPEDFLPGIGDWIWALYQSPDASGAAAFYQDIGGYEVLRDSRFEDTPHFMLVAGGYARASLAEIAAERSGMRPDWLYFLRVRDVAATVARATALGGRVIVAPQARVLDGRIAVIADPGGAPVGLMAWDESGAEDR